MTDPRTSIHRGLWCLAAGVVAMIFALFGSWLALIACVLLFTVGIILVMPGRSRENEEG